MPLQHQGFGRAAVARPVAEGPRGDVDPVRELKRNFSGTWIPASSVVLLNGTTTKVAGGDAVFLKHIGESEYSTPAMRCAMLDIKQLKIGHKKPGTTKIDGVIDINEDYPQLGMVNYKRAVVYISRVPSRQWKRGYCEGTIKLGSPVHMEMYSNPKMFKYPKLMDIDLVRNIFSARYPTVKSAYKKVATLNSLGVAFNNKYAFVLKRGASKILLAYKLDVVGYVNDDNLSVTLAKCASHLSQELGNYVEVNIK